MGNFFGTYERTLDTKGRLQLPTKLVKEMPPCLYLLRGFEGAVSLYTEETFESYLASLSKLPYLDASARAYLRLATSSVERMEVDSHGRITLGSAITKRYSLGNNIVLIGVLDHMELWDQSAYEAYWEKHSSSYEDIAENLSRLNGAKE